MTTATPFKIHLTPEDTGLLTVKQTEEAAKTISDLLQEDLETHHVFFNNSGFHNHIPHHLLTLFSTGAPPSALSAAYTSNKSYQRPALPLHPPPSPSASESSVVVALQTSYPTASPSYLGKEQYYPDFLRFFQLEIANSPGGWPDVLKTYLFSGSSDADALLVRLFAGFLHPLIQLLYGVEFRQPAVVAEALAWAAVHSDGGGLREFLVGAERAATTTGEGGGESMGELYAAVRGCDKVRGAPRWEDGNKVRDGVLGRAMGEMVALAGRVRVDGGEVDARTAEMFDGAVGVAAVGALEGGRWGRGPRFDFFLIHHVNAAPIFLTLNKQEWIPTAAKVRLLEWKMRMDLLQYAARGCPDLDVERIRRYQPKCVEAGNGVKPIDIISRLHTFADDGHAIKLGRAALICQQVCRAYQGTPVADRFMIKGDDLWERLLGLIVDSVEAPGENWVRSAGMEEAWKDIPRA
ncbi:HypA protein [Podospora conica]|nr:HypA protein [Schizothecium conicum]